MKIPTMDFRGQKFVNEDGTLTSVAQTFFDLLEKMMNQSLGDEGVVAPSQNAKNIGIIENNTVTSPNGLQTKTCAFGTIIYDQTNNVGKLAVNDGSGNPIFKTIVTM